jgi:hypothetical protein
MNRILAVGSWMLAIGTLHGQTPRDEAGHTATDLVSKKLGLTSADVRVVTIAEATWRDSSLGCPERGHVYTPAQIGGFRVIVEAGTTRYDVRTAGGRAVLCNGGAQPSTAEPRETVRPALDAASLARRHLGNRLRIEPADLVIRRIRPWRTADGICEPPAGVKRGGATFLVELARDEHLYRYRATRDDAWACPDVAQQGKR